MKDILFNLALIDLTKFCIDNDIDCAGSHLIKVGRGFKYALINDKTGKEIVSVLFHKHSTPEHFAIV
jgi:hypothetical protein